MADFVTLDGVNCGLASAETPLFVSSRFAVQMILLSNEDVLFLGIAVDFAVDLIATLGVNCGFS